MKFPLVPGAVLAFAGWALVARAQPPPAPAVHHELDFWLGDWEAFAGGTLDGTDRIERVLDGAAVIEHWHDVSGHEGKSLFYFYRPENRWKQVWVTDVGAVKEKVCIAVFPGGGTRFRGEIPLRAGGTVLDQTTLTPLPDGTVHQLIEQSADGGRTWQTTFDAIYRRKQSP